MSTTIERQIIIGALQLLDSPEKWCKNTLTQVGPNGERQFCIRGALFQAGKALGFLGNGEGYWTKQAMQADNLVAKAYTGRAMGGAHVTFQNRPSTTFAQMRSLLQRALTI